MSTGPLQPMGWPNSQYLKVVDTNGRPDRIMGRNFDVRTVLPVRIGNQDYALPLIPLSQDGHGYYVTSAGDPYRLDLQG